MQAVGRGGDAGLTGQRTVDVASVLAPSELCGAAVVLARADTCR